MKTQSQHRVLDHRIKRGFAVRRASLSWLACVATSAIFAGCNKNAQPNIASSEVASAARAQNAARNVSEEKLHSAPTASNSASVSATVATQKTAVLRLNYRVIGKYAHDARAFTQGLLWHNGGFYESTGLYGQSTLRRVEFPSGRVIVKKSLPSQYFAEGLALANDKLVQITWTSGQAFVYERATFKLLQTWNYDGEGWGLTFDGANFVMSNGSDTLTWRDAKTFKTVRQLRVTLNGEPLKLLNEIEWVAGRVWANVWKTDFVVQIDPRNGKVVSYLDLSGLHQRSGNEDVLNGIAYDADKKRVFITGKLWPTLYEIKIE